MVLKRLFASGKAPVANTNNEAGGRAYAFSPEHALAQYAVTGTMHNTFYASAEQQLDDGPRAGREGLARVSSRRRPSTAESAAS